jgi:proline iminopeptidase
MRFIRALALALISAVIASVIVYFAVVRPRVRTWGVDPGEADLHLPGDDLIAEPSHTETRGIDIAAPPDKVWPWLVQMGFGRAGWYSYDAMDMKGSSADSIVPEFQALEVGDVMPTHPGGGFVVKVLEPERALVLFTDTELVKAQAEQAQATGTDELPTPGLKVSGAMMSASYPEFSASWAFFLQPNGPDGTRLIERFRAKTPGSGPASAVLGEIMGTGIVLMTRKQMLGIQERVEQPAPEPVAV